jgi:cation diffusion facilitator CzcD-associated flavoprotein CzcO
MYSSSVDVAIIGAGPYGLSLACFLRQRGVEYRIFGPPMHAWASMSPGMYLKSFGFATSVYTPKRHYTLPEYCRARGLEDFEPIEIATFAKYGVWVQQELVPDLEETNVTGLRRFDDAFEVTLETGERVHARRVVVAVGLSYFERVPEVFAGLPRDLASHTAQHGDFSRFHGMDVTVVGGGQSALQAAALLHEHGARVQMVVRRGVWFSTRMPDKRSLRERVLLPNTVLGPGRENWVLQHVPLAMHYVPVDRRVRFTRRHLGPYGAWWLRDRVVDKFPILERSSVLEATPKGAQVALRIKHETDGEREILTDHVIGGTGYAVDVDRIAFLDGDLAAQIRRIERAPDLSRHFESSVRGLYFVGPSAAYSFGPLFRFVAGAEYAAPALARHLAWRSGPLAAAWRWPGPATHVALEPVEDPALEVATPHGKA